MKSNHESVPSAWVWSHYKATLEDNMPEIPLAWVWSQYSLAANASGPGLPAQGEKKLDSRFLFAAAALVLLIFAGIYKESLETNAPPHMNDVEMANAQISKALSLLKEAYKISPREETEKVIIQIEKIQPR